MAKKQKYYIQQSSGSWSVFERGCKQIVERFCIVPMVTLSEAKKCCASLNAGDGAWDWLGNSLVMQDSHYSVVALRG